MESILIIIFLLYLMLVAGLIIGWRKATRAGLPQEGERENKISVVIAARNEEQSVPSLIQDLKNQSYYLFEVIFVNDHSEDSTVDVVNYLINDDSRFSIINNLGAGKKEALAAGIGAASGDLIVTTDADCCVGPEWLHCINQYFQTEELKMAFGGVRMATSEASLFSVMQAIEFSSLIGTGAATIAMGIPTMCNGANLVLRKDIINEVDGFEDNKHIPSGDDEFLLRKVFKKYPKGVCFMATTEVIVSTPPQITLYDFIQQRIRWAGKWRYHDTMGSKILAISILLFQLIFIAILPLTLAGAVSVTVFLFLITLKVVGEIIFLKQVTNYLKIRWNWLAFILLQGLYPFYVVFVGIISYFQPFTWKGRLLNSIKPKVGPIADND